MNYPDEIKRVTTLLGMDKGISPKWRNKAVARLDEALAFINQGIAETNQFHAKESGLDDLSFCICISYPDSINRKCPVHGQQVS
jgi:hypothetical protein